MANEEVRLQAREEKKEGGVTRNLEFPPPPLSQFTLGRTRP